jgi:molecular chaperone IbpA
MTSLSFRSKDFAPFYQNSIGIDRLFNDLISNVNTEQGNYPPYNIIKEDENHYLIEIAVAGFREGDINVSVEQNVLTIDGDGHANQEREYIHQGLSNRKFTRTFNLAEHIEVKSAEIVNGILHIGLEREVPEQLLPKAIDVKYIK